MSTIFQTRLVELSILFTTQTKGESCGRHEQGLSRTQCAAIEDVCDKGKKAGGWRREGRKLDKSNQKVKNRTLS